MTIPFNVPNVTPSAVLPPPQTIGQAIQPGVNALIDILRIKEQSRLADRDFAAKQVADAYKQGIDQQVGDMQAQLLPMLARPGVMGGQIPTIPGVTMAPGTVQRDMTAERLSRVFAGRPGTVIENVARTSANAIQQAISRDQEQMTKVAKPTDRNTELRISDVDGTGILVDRNAGTSQLILDDNGKPRIFKDVNKPAAVGQPRPLGKYTKNGREYIAWVKPGTTGVSLEPLPDGFSPSGVPTQAQQQAASRYLTSSTAFAQAKGDAGIPRDAANYILSQVKINSQTPMAQWITQAALDDPTKQSLLNWTTILQNTVYKNSGAAVTVAEFNRAFQRIPVQGDSKALRDQKLQLTRMDIYSDYLTGRNELGRSTMLNPEVGVPAFQDLWEEPGDVSLSPEDRQKAQTDPGFAEFLRKQGLWP